jgi:hypothetical protein
MTEPTAEQRMARAFAFLLGCAGAALIAIVASLVAIGHAIVGALK